MYGDAIGEWNAYVTYYYINKIMKRETWNIEFSNFFECQIERRWETGQPWFRVRVGCRHPNGMYLKPFTAKFAFEPCINLDFDELDAILRNVQAQKDYYDKDPGQRADMLARRAAKLDAVKKEEERAALEQKLKQMLDEGVFS